MLEVQKISDIVDLILDGHYGKVKKIDDLVEEKCNVIKEENGEVTLDTFKDYVADLKSKGYDDEEKLKGMLDKAKKLAADQGKEGDKQAILGIFQKFFMSK